MVDLIQSHNIGLARDIAFGKEKIFQRRCCVAFRIQVIAKILNEFAVEILGAFEAHAVDICRSDIIPTFKLFTHFTNERTLPRTRRSADIHAATRLRSDS